METFQDLFFFWWIPKTYDSNSFAVNFSYLLEIIKLNSLHIARISLLISIIIYQNMTVNISVFPVNFKIYEKKFS